MIDTDKVIKTEDKNQGDLKVMEEMYRAGVHFGYSQSLSHPKMRPFFFGLRNNTEIFNLEKTFALLKNAEDFMKELGGRQATVLLVSTKPEAKEIIEKLAKEMSFSFVTERWLGGTLTNFNQIKKRIDEFNNLSERKAKGEFSNLSKKDISNLDKKLAKMEREIGGLKSLSSTPAAVVIVDSKEEKPAVTEAKKMKVSIIAIMNSDCDPTGIDYPVPGNDSSVTSTEYLLNRLVEAYKLGRKKVVE